MLSVDFTQCPDPECNEIAEVADRLVVASTDAPVEHVKGRCVAGHVFGWMPAEYLERTGVA